MALADAIAKRLEGRSGIRHDTETAREKFPEVEGRTKDIAASVFDLDDIDALKVERDENDQRKEPTTSEKVALAQAIAERLDGRKGSNQHVKKEGPEIFPDAQGDTRDIAAKKAGLGSGKTLEAAQRVVERGTPELVEAMAVPVRVVYADRRADVVLATPRRP